MQQHACGACKQIFDTEEQYLSHVCPETQETPDTIEHQDALTGGNFSRIAEASQVRGAARA